MLKIKGAAIVSVADSDQETHTLVVMKPTTASVDTVAKAYGRIVDGIEIEDPNGTFTKSGEFEVYEFHHDDGLKVLRVTLVQQ